MNTSRRGYVLLETVIATGLLIVGLAVIGAEIQDSDTAIRQMRLRLRAMTLAEQHLAEMDLGLIELDSVDEVQDGDFGPRYPDFGWRLTTEPTAIEGLFRLTLDVMHHIRESPYKEDDFEVETAEKIFTAYAFRAAPQSLDLGADFGLKDDKLEQVSQKLSDAGVPGLTAQSFDPAILAKLDFEQMVQVLPVILDALGVELGDLEAMIPPEVLEELKKSGVLDQLGGSDKPGVGGD
ncbi:MAG: hypothetical protein V1790_13140 [Planctomycetota bacterium]